MPLYARRPATSAFRVEVSGWDSSAAFFVEKSELEWGEETGKHITLFHSLRAGAMVFVRLLQPTDKDRSWPVVYQVECIASTRDGTHQFRLSQVQPRMDVNEQFSR